MKREDELLVDRQPFAVILAHLFGFSLAESAENPVEQNQGISIIAARILVAQRGMMETVVPDGGEEKGIECRRVRTHFGMCKSGHHGEHIEAAEQCSRVEIKDRDHAETDQEQFDRIADRSFHRIELGDVMVRRVGQPGGVPVVHQPVHPILAEFI